MKKIFKLLIFVFVLMLISYPILNAKSYGWGFVRNSTNDIPEIGKYSDEIHDTSSYYVGDVNEKIIYLTFDAGYDNGNLEKIINILDNKKVKATFFVTGDFIKRQSNLVKLIYDNGHIIGNHTYSHRNITSLDDTQLKEDVTKLEEMYKQLLNTDMPKFFRPPAGEFNKSSLKVIKSMGYKTIFWSIAYKDWDTSNQLGYNYTYNSVIDNLHNGAIILMHTVSNDNVLALNDIIDEVLNKGYIFGNLYDLKSS